MILPVKHLFRTLYIARVLAKYDALFWIHKPCCKYKLVSLIARLISRKSKLREGQRLVLAFEELGPFFIKLGQALSVRSDIVGDEIAKDLIRLQDSLPAYDSNLAKKTIEEDIGKPVEALFSQFNDKPVAAASIAQVHFAKDLEGNEVAVKVLRPDIGEIFDRDIKLLSWIADRAEKRPAFKRLKPREVINAFRKSVEIELDLGMEAAAAAELAENFANDDILQVPSIDWTRTSRRVLTTQRVGGIRIDRRKELVKKGVDPDLVLKKASAIFFKQVFQYGFFHADMHPGNVFVTEDGNIAAVDFGIMGRIDIKTRRYLAEMLIGFLTGDYKKVADIHFDAGYTPKYQSKALFAQACRSFGEPLFSLPQSKISLAKVLGQMFKITERFDMPVQPQLLLLQKTMLMAEGVGRMLNPNVNFWEMARPLMEEWSKSHLGAKAKAKESVDEALEMLTQLKLTINNLSEVITSKGIRLHPDTVSAMKNKKI